MNDRVVIFDVSYLCYRAYYSTGELIYGGQDTGVLYGFLRDFREIYETLQPTHCSFAFDSTTNFRKTIDPNYKSNRKDMTEEDRKVRRSVGNQRNQLGKTILRQLGFENIHRYKGFEADDIIAAIAAVSVADCFKPREVIIISADKDLYQCIRPHVSLYDPNKKQYLDFAGFQELTGLDHPRQWKSVKALAGCPTDCVPGIKGVGEVTACKYIRGELTKGVKFDAIEKRDMKRHDINLSLVKLPFKGTPTPVLKPDKIDWSQWDKICKRFGFRSLMYSQSGRRRGFYA